MDEGVQSDKPGSAVPLSSTEFFSVFQLIVLVLRPAFQQQQTVVFSKQALINLLYSAPNSRGS